MSDYQDPRDRISGNHEEESHDPASGDRRGEREPVTAEERAGRVFEGTGKETQHQGRPAFSGSMPDEEEVKTRKLIREELKRNYRKKSSWLRTLALVLAAAVLGAFGGVGLLKSGLLPSSLQLESADSGSDSKTVDIKLSNDSTAENAVAKKAVPSIVGITTEVQAATQNPFMYGIPKYAEAVGSGVIVSSDGLILTNSHVVDNGKAKNIKVLLSNKEEVEGKLLWNDPTLDLAVLKVDKKNLKAIEFGDSDKVQVGDKAIAIGNPLGLDLQSTLTSGYVSGLDRSITLQDGNVMDGLIQTDAAINSGNSGGALLNAKGQLVGINTAKPQSADGIGFAIPISTAKKIVDKVAKDGTFEPIYLGITGYNVQIAKQLGMEDLPTKTGVIVHDVVAGSPAAKAGVSSGDVITALDGKEIDSMNSLKTALINYSIGQKAKLSYYHNGKAVEKEIEFVNFKFSENKQ